MLLSRKGHPILFVKSNAVFAYNLNSHTIADYFKYYVAKVLQILERCLFLTYKRRRCFFMSKKETGEKSRRLNKIVSENIRGIMFGCGETVKDFCKAYGMTRQSFYLRTTGKVSWDMSELQFVCERYNVPIERLVGGYMVTIKSGD